MKLKLGELSATMLCHYTSMADVVNQAFGEGEKDSDRVDLGNAPTFEAAVANINAAMTFG